MTKIGITFTLTTLILLGASPLHAQEKQLPIETTFQALCDERGTRIQLHVEPLPASPHWSDFENGPRCTLIGDHLSTRYSCQCSAQEDAFGGRMSEILLDPNSPATSVNAERIDQTCMALRQDICGTKGRSIRVDCGTKGLFSSGCSVFAQAGDNSGFFDWIKADCECADGQRWNASIDSTPVQLNKEVADTICQEQLQGCEARPYQGAAATLVNALSGADVRKARVNMESVRLDNVFHYDKCATDWSRGFVKTTCYCVDDSKVERSGEFEKVSITQIDQENRAGLTTCQAIPTPPLIPPPGSDDAQGVDAQDGDAQDGDAQANDEGYEDQTQPMACSLRRASDLSSWVGLCLLGGLLRRRRRQ